MSNKLETVWTKKFKKDHKSAKKQGRDMELLYNIIEKLSNRQKLAPKHNDHALKGNYKGCRECHVEPDWILVYMVEDDILILTLIETGTHADLFKK